MDAIEKAFTELGAAIEGFRLATVRVRDARAALDRALDGSPVADSPTSNEVAKPAKVDDAPRAKPETSPPAAKPKPAPAATGAAWTPALAKKLLREIAGGASVLAAIAAAGGTVRMDQVPRADGDGVMGPASVPALFSNIRTRARSAGIELPIASQADGKVTLDPGLCAVLRAMGGAS